MSEKYIDYSKDALMKFESTEPLPKHLPQMKLEDFLECNVIKTTNKREKIIERIQTDLSDKIDELYYKNEMTDYKYQYDDEYKKEVFEIVNLMVKYKVKYNGKHQNKHS